MEEIFTESVKDELLDACLQYVVICTCDPHTDDPQLNKVYSLLIIKSHRMPESETRFVYDISRTRERALEIAAMMREHTVTPCTVNDILEDIL